MKKLYSFYQSRIQVLAMFEKSLDKIVEAIDTAAIRQTVVTLCRAVLFKAIKQPQKCSQNRFRKIAETAIHLVFK